MHVPGLTGLRTRQFATHFATMGPMTDMHFPGDRMPPGVTITIGRVAVTGPTGSRPYHRLTYTDEYGRRRQLSGGRTASGAIRRARQVDEDLARGSSPSRRDAVTVGDVWQAWMDTESPGWGMEYTSQCERAIRGHLSPIATIRTIDLTGDHIQAVLNEMAGSTRGEQKRLIQKVQPFLKWAYREHLIPHPHTTYLGRLRYLPDVSVTNRTRTDAMAISPEEVPTTDFVYRMAHIIREMGIEKAESERRRNFHPQRFGKDAFLAILLQAHTGMRQGEVRALTLGDFLWVDNQLSGRIQVHANYREHAGGKRELKAPKNDKIRVVRMPAWTAPRPDPRTGEPRTAREMLKTEFGPEKNPRFARAWDLPGHRKELLEMAGLVDLHGLIATRIDEAKERDPEHWHKHLVWRGARDRQVNTQLPIGATEWPPNGNWAPIDYFRRYWWNESKRRSIVFKDAPWTPRHLRHYAASKFIQSGMSITEVADQLGHANPDVTLRVYARIIGGDTETPWSLEM